MPPRTAGQEAEHLTRVMRVAHAMRMSDEAWADVLNVNLTGAFFMARAVLRPMLRARGGRIINMPKD